MENPSPVYVYPLENSRYINLCNRCTAHCVFCPITNHPVVAGHNLTLSMAQEPSVAQVIALLNEPRLADEIVFCGFGEPTLRLDALKQIAQWIKHRGGRTRLNTNGHGNLIHGRDITPELHGLIDSISISLNAANAQDYARIMRPVYGQEAFTAVLEFVRLAKQFIPQVIVSAVAIPGLDTSACKQLADEMQVEFRLRPHADLSQNIRRGRFKNT